MTEVFVFVGSMALLAVGFWKAVKVFSGLTAPINEDRVYDRRL